MIYRHRFWVPASPEEVANFHRHGSNLGAITPPPILLRMGQAPEILTEGDIMSFTLWFGPLPVRWRAKIEDVHPNGFTDRQLAGPFEHWEHRHRFEPVDGGTEVIDEVHYRPRRHLFWGPFGWGMGLSLPLLFAFRGWKTRRLLNRSTSEPV